MQWKPEAVCHLMRIPHEHMTDMQLSAEASHDGKTYATLTVTLTKHLTYEQWRAISQIVND